MSVDIERKIKEFRRDLKTNSDLEILRKYIIFGERHTLSEEQYTSLRQKIAKRWNVHPTEVILVGSGKTGFSISEKPVFHKKTLVEKKPRYRKFSAESDIDVAIVSRTLFDQIWLQIYRYDLNRPYWLDREKFQNYFFKGWIRPDKMPLIKGDCIRTKWFEFFNDISSTKEFGDHSVKGALYAGWEFLENYQTQAIAQCRKNETSAK